MEERVKTGIKGLDKMLQGGLYRGTITVVKGAPGTGKSCFAIEFLGRGTAEFGEAGLYVTFEHFPEQLYRDASSIGFDFKRHEQDGKLKILFVSPRVFTSQLKEAGGEFDQLMVKHNIQRIVVDSINHLVEEEQDVKKFRALVYSFVNAFRRYNATTLITQEDPTIIGEFTAVEFGLSFMTDTLIQLRFVEIESAFKRALLVIKQRASAHDAKIREFQITSKGIQVEEPFKGKEGILSGAPRDVARRVEEFYK